MTTVTVSDMRAAGVCQDTRFWFRRHGLDWRSFVLNGIAADELLAVGDQADLVAAVIACAVTRENSNG